MANKTVTVAKRGRGDFNLYNGTSAGKTFTRTASDGSTTLTLRSIGYTVDVLEVYGGGTAYTDATISSAITAIGTTNNVGLMLNPGRWIISNNLTIPANLTLILPPGAILSDNGGTANLTINGPFEAGKYQVFDWTGSGAVDLTSSLIDHGYAEWWGVDGTDDEVQINQALTACKGVQLLGFTYVISAVTPVSNGWLRGMGEGTILQMDTSSQAGININDVVDFEVSNLKVDGDSAGLTNSVSLKIQGTSRNIRVNNVWLYDSDVTALQILPGDADTIQDIYIDKLVVDTGCSSSAITVAGNSTAGTASTTKNIFFENTKILSCGGTGISVNGWTSVNASNVVDNINFNNLLIKSSGGIGFTANENATNVHLSNFCIDGAGSNGIQQESVDGWSVSNGVVKNGSTNGINCTETTAAADSYGARNGVIENVRVHDNTSYGIYLVGKSTGSVTNIDVVNCSVYDNGSTGIGLGYASRIKLIGNTCYDNGGAGNSKGGIVLPNSVADIDDVLIANNICYGSDQDFGIRVGSNTVCNDIKVLGNQCFDNNDTDMSIVSTAANPSDIEGESVTYRLGTIAAGTSDERPCFVAPGPNGTVILDVLLCNVAAIAAHATNYTTFTLRDKSTDGTANNAIVELDTNTADDNISFVAFDPVSMADTNNISSTHKILEPDTACSIVKTDSGAGVATDEMLLTIKYISY